MALHVLLWTWLGQLEDRGVDSRELHGSLMSAADIGNLLAESEALAPADLNDVQEFVGVEIDRLRQHPTVGPLLDGPLAELTINLGHALSHLSDPPRGA